MRQHQARGLLTSEVGQPPNPRNWHLPLPSPLTELEGEKKETCMISKRGQDQPMVHAAPLTPSSPQRQHMSPRKGPTFLKTLTTASISPKQEAHASSPAGGTPAPAKRPPTYHLLVGLALGAGLGLPGLLNVLSCETPHGGLVLMEEPSLEASGKEKVSGVCEEPPVDSAQQRSGLAWEPSFPKWSTGNIGGSRSFIVGVTHGCRW